jgi:hypothetical protein
MAVRTKRVRASRAARWRPSGRDNVEFEGAIG